MRQVAWVLVWGCFISSISSASTELTHLERLKSRYPYGLIGNDYGLLTQEDLAINTCDAEVAPFSGEKNMAYSYWQCFPLKDTEMECESSGFDPAFEKKKMGYMEIKAHGQDGVQSYLARDAMDMSECRDWLRVWKRKTRGERHVCLSGSYAAFSGFRDGGKETDWVFDKFKTRKGCESHRNECHLLKNPDSHCVLPENWVRQRIR